MILSDHTQAAADTLAEHKEDMRGDLKGEAPCFISVRDLCIH